MTASRLTTLLSLFALTGAALLPTAQAVSPPPDALSDGEPMRGTESERSEYEHVERPA